ncbi:NADH dehydrogenase [ubiquinone] 1 alpha subcomplex assembly factor 3 [Phlebotomus argentipes]|uniref:NADH dehydrogenase [ubiquinone] 1 alpha subcomplex assembly factor 3 n=1 Tax=Phlebotomus argentipes TaxID=94469 RepID=UPI0028932377|nr:NADH dehydrogenase [ubiquinone] 1 alpha subcomplex assembly factor 3 [Phlebotomus argentipes]
MNIFGREIMKKVVSFGPRLSKQCSGALICSRNGHSYEGDGKTTIKILNKEVSEGLMINAFSQIGFRLNNRMNVIGPMAIFPRIALSWNVGSFEDINEESLSLFTVLEPKIDILVVGVGDEKITPQFSKKIMNFMRSSRINVDVLNTEQACSTFNFLNSEGRVVAGAIIPPRTLRFTDHDRFHSGKPILHEGNTYAEGP